MGQIETRGPLDQLHRTLQNIRHPAPTAFEIASMLRFSGLPRSCGREIEAAL